jgi:VWFA-related protein
VSIPRPAAILILPVIFTGLFLRSQTPANQSSAGARVATPVIQSTTRLVQISVVARDKDGRPAEGLQANDFRISADGSPQKIAFFSVESTGKVAAPNPPLPPHTFTNLLEARGDRSNSITVVLLDLVNTRLADRLYARQQLVKYLGDIQPQDRIGVYVFNGRLRVLHDYTADMSELQQKIAIAKDKLVNVSRTEEPGALTNSDVIFSQMMNGAGGGQQERAFFMRNRVLGTLDVLKFIADHLAQVPGRKNLLWMSGGFPLTFGYENSSIFSENFAGDMDATIQALSDANVAVYPIDARGLVSPPAFEAGRRAPSAALNSNPINNSAGRVNSRPPAPGNVSSTGKLSAIHENMDDLAHRTGGRAYYNTNDLARAIHDAVSDSTLTYNLAFYPENEKNNREFHKIKVEVDRPHMNLLYRSGYLDLPQSAPDDKMRLVQLRDALWSPLEATELGLTVQAKLEPAGSSGSVTPMLDVTLNIRPDGIATKLEGDRHTGRLDVLMVQFDSHGNQLDGPMDTIDLKMLDDTYRRFMLAGVPVSKKLPLSPGAASLRVVVRDAGSGMIGSITVPLADI